MIYFLYGNDFKKAREKLNSLVKDISGGKTDVSVLKFNEDNAGECNLQNLVSEQGLFEKEIVVVLDNLFSSEILGEDVFETLPEMKKAKNTFLILENNLEKKKVDTLKKYATESEEFSLRASGLPVFNPFSLGDALGERNKRRLWVCLYKALEEGLSAEEIHGILFWQIKSILIAKEAKDQNESGLKPFVYGKAKRFSSKFKTEDLRKMSTDLVDLYHNSRKGLTELPIALEKFVLKI